MRECVFTYFLFDFEQVGALKDHLNEIYGSVGSSLGGGGSSARCSKLNYDLRKYVSKNLNFFCRSSRSPSRALQQPAMEIPVSPAKLSEIRS